MKRLNLQTAIAVGLALACANLGRAQDAQPVSSITGQPPGGESRIELGLAFAQSLGSQSFSASQTLSQYVENATFNSAYKVGGAPGGGLDLQYNLSGKFGLRLGAQTSSRKSTGTFDAQIPHPFFFSRPRNISGSESGLGFSEAAYSLTAVYRGGSGKWKLNLEGGPALFSVRATVAEKANFSESYPFDTATYSGITSMKKSASPIGFALGLEIGRELTPSVILVAQGRFSQGSGKLNVEGSDIDFTAGGAQARVGLRFVLARKRAGGE